jgi:hypothetical protein
MHKKWLFTPYKAAFIPLQLCLRYKQKPITPLSLIYSRRQKRWLFIQFILIHVTGNRKAAKTVCKNRLHYFWVYDKTIYTAYFFMQPGAICRRTGCPARQFAKKN